MRLPRPKTADTQLRLFDAPKTITAAAARSWVGDYFESQTARLTGAVRLRTDCRADICPDLRYDDRTFFECKGCGKNQNVTFYRGRVEKDLSFIEATGSAVVYWLWSHSFPVNEAGDLTELREGLRQTTRRLVVVGHDVLAAVVRDRQPRTLNTAYTRNGTYRLGYGNARAGYGEGWCVPLSVFAERCHTAHVRTRGEYVGFPVLISDIRFLGYFR